MYEEFGATTSAYWASKACVEALTHYMAGIGGKHNIRVNCVRPGQIMTSGARGGTLHDPDGDIRLREVVRSDSDCPICFDERDEFGLVMVIRK